MTHIVGIGGTTKPASSTELALRLALDSARQAGAEVTLFDGAFLVALPHYGTGDCAAPDIARFVDTIRSADGVIIASPGYHGSVSGLVKNAIDYIEQTATDPRVYLDGVPVGLIATAYGWAATGSTMSTMRAIVHALRGWPTPLGAGIKSTPGLFTEDGCTDPKVAAQLLLVGRQVQEFAQLRRDRPNIIDTGPQ
ncbi:NADPH-dependent FMN reductase [Sphingomonas sp.]|jgi:FMN reductase|uniref:NADPH-dependent FMN reductase n=1 Tax=Sphingomonas sp. TaxID=28214 RepID=UPI002D7E64D6|nr:NADPH-dependent FMN reductase [Sphingomonas sp.]HEU0043957.1 NADPH-dependent FMN reductase [Sphingomonas sp.]